MLHHAKVAAKNEPEHRHVKAQHQQRIEKRPDQAEMAAPQRQLKIASGELP